MTSRRKTLARLLGITAALALPGVSMAAELTKEEKRAEVRKTANGALQRLYKLQPRARQHIAGAAGYAAFSNFGMKIFVAGGGTGEGIAVDQKTKQETFMKMVEVQAGLGFGVKKVSVIFVFDSHEQLRRFIDSGWEIGAQGTAAAMAPGAGAAINGALSVAPGVWIYQLTDKGLALELTAKGTKYYKNDELN